MRILDEIGTIVGEEWLYRGYEDAERLLHKMGVIATIAAYEWLYQGRKLYERQSGGGMIDRLNNPKTEHTRKPRSTKESSDSIDRESEDRQGNLDVLLQAIHGFSKSLLSEYQELSRKGVFQRQAANQSHQERIEVLREVTEILQEVTRGAKQLPRSQMASRSGAV